MESFTQILEKKDNEYKSIKATILFTDVVGSSQLWSKHDDKMFDSLIKHEELVNDLIKDKGYVVKSIGDSFMCIFEDKDSLLDAVEFTKELIEKIKKIKVGKDNLKLRIGIAYGSMNKRKTNIQNNDVWDFFGNAVNTGSRLESKVSDENGFAFAMINDVDKSDEKKLTDMIDKLDYEIIDFDSKCKDKNEKVVRSGRLLSDMQRNKCKDIDELKGVKPLRVYKVKL